jgi:hypothetical protein
MHQRFDRQAGAVYNDSFLFSQDESKMIVTKRINLI